MSALVPPAPTHVARRPRACYDLATLHCAWAGCCFEPTQFRREPCSNAGYAAGRRCRRAGTHLLVQVRNKPVYVSCRASFRLQTCDFGLRQSRIQNPKTKMIYLLYGPEEFIRSEAL